jgi:hypothetical protein
MWKAVIVAGSKLRELGTQIRVQLLALSRNPQPPVFLQSPAKMSNLTIDSALYIKNIVVQVPSPTYDHAHMAKIY